MEEKGPLLSLHTYTINRKSIKLVARKEVVKCFGAAAAADVLLRKAF